MSAERISVPDGLVRELQRIDGRGYKAYSDLKGRWFDLGLFSACLDHTQSDPFAPPSLLRLHIPVRQVGIPSHLLEHEEQITPCEDFLLRRIYRGCRNALSIARPGQQVLKRTAVRIYPEAHVSVRMRVQLPARGRRILGRECAKIFSHDLPRLVQDALVLKSSDLASLETFVRTFRNQEHLRSQLKQAGLIAWLAEGSRLARRSGVDDRPLEDGYPLHIPDPLSVTLTSLEGTPLKGLGIPAGITLIVGGGYHGKSTLLRAVERGIYNHIPGDGREQVVTLPDAVKIRAEDGRSVSSVDISPFINNLPFGQPTKDFSTENASGSTSQAASIVEMVQAGAHTLLIDEDTSASNFMYRDARMQMLIKSEDEPITPFIDRCRELHERFGVSSLIVLGGSGDYFAVADKVIQMKEYQPIDVTERAKQVATQGTVRKAENETPWPELSERIPLPRSLDPSRGKHSIKIQAKGADSILFGRNPIDISALEQLVSDHQVNTLAVLLERFYKMCDGTSSLTEIITSLFSTIREGGWDRIVPFTRGDLAETRPLELFATINRIRGIKFSTKHSEQS